MIITIILSLFIIHIWQYTRATVIQAVKIDVPNAKHSHVSKANVHFVYSSYRGTHQSVWSRKTLVLYRLKLQSYVSATAM